MRPTLPATPQSSVSVSTYSPVPPFLPMKQDHEYKQAQLEDSTMTIYANRYMQFWLFEFSQTVK